MELLSKLRTSFQKQYNAERQNQAVYTAFQNYFDAQTWDGFSKWMKKSAQEEGEHAQKLADYLVSRNCVPEIQSLESVAVSGSPRELFQKALELEMGNTASLTELYLECLKFQCYEAGFFLEWYLDEQRKSERELTDILQMFDHAGNDNAAIMMIDERLGE